MQGLSGIIRVQKIRAGSIDGQRRGLTIITARRGGCIRGLGSAITVRGPNAYSAEVWIFYEMRSNLSVVGIGKALDGLEKELAYFCCLV